MQNGSQIPPRHCSWWRSNFPYMQATQKKLIIPTKSKESTVNAHTIHWIKKLVLQCKMEVKYLLDIAPGEEAIFPYYMQAIHSNIICTYLYHSGKWTDGGLWIKSQSCRPILEQLLYTDSSCNLHKYASYSLWTTQSPTTTFWEWNPTSDANIQLDTTTQPGSYTLSPNTTSINHPHILARVNV
jgi:hypothetical protein